MKHVPAKKRGIEWTDEPPKPEFPSIKIERVPAAGKLEFVICSPAVIGVRTHFQKPKTFPHQENREECTGCVLRLPIRWRGYLLCLDSEMKRPRIAEITYQGYQSCPDFKRLAGQLAGRKLFQVRMGAGVNGRQVCSLGIQMKLPDLRGMPDLREMLCHIWDGRAVDQDEPNEQGG